MPVLVWELNPRPFLSIKVAPAGLASEQRRRYRLFARMRGLETHDAQRFVLALLCIEHVRKWPHAGLPHHQVALKAAPAPAPVQRDGEQDAVGSHGKIALLWPGGYERAVLGPAFGGGGLALHRDLVELAERHIPALRPGRARPTGLRQVGRRWIIDRQDLHRRAAADQ